MCRVVFQLYLSSVTALNKNTNFVPILCPVHDKVFLARKAQNAQNGTERSKKPKLVKEKTNWHRVAKKAQNGPRWPQVAQNGPKGLECRRTAQEAQNGPKRPQKAQNGPG